MAGVVYGLAIFLSCYWFGYIGLKFSLIIALIILAHNIEKHPVK